jgi:hypothetical protein
MIRDTKGSGNPFRFIGDNSAELNNFKLASVPEVGDRLFMTDHNKIYIFDGALFKSMDVDVPTLLNNTSTTISGSFSAIKFMTDGVRFTTLASNIKTNGSVTPMSVADINNCNLPQGEVLTGSFTSIRLQAGTVLLIP